MPNHAAYLETFAAHNSDLGENGHGFRRDESVALQPALKSLLAAYEKNGGMDEVHISRWLKNVTRSLCSRPVACFQRKPGTD